MFRWFHLLDRRRAQMRDVRTQCTEDAAKWFRPLFLLKLNKLRTCRGSCFYSIDAANPCSSVPARLADLSIVRAIKLCRFCSHVGNRCIASDLIRRIAQDLRMGRDIVWKTDEAGERALFAYAVLFDFVLNGAKADPEEFGGLLPVVGDFRQSAPDGFPFDLLQG